MTWIITITDKGIKFTSDYAKATFLDFRKKDPQQKFKLIPEEKVSREKRGFYYGVIIPAYADWSENYDRKNKNDLLIIHDLFRNAFNGEVIEGLQGKPVRIAHSISLMNNKEYGAFLERIEAYFSENQITFPDPALYKLWRDKFSYGYPVYMEYLSENNMRVDGSPITL